MYKSIETKAMEAIGKGCSRKMIAVGKLSLE